MSTRSRTVPTTKRDEDEALSASQYAQVMNVDLSSIHLNCEVNGQTLPDRLDKDGHRSEHESLLITKREDGSSSKPSRRMPSAQSLPASSELTVRALSTQSIEKCGPEAVTPFETADPSSRMPSAPP